MKNHLRTATGSSRKIRSRRIILIPAAFIALSVVVGFLATIPVTGNHSYWRTFRALPGDFGLKAEDVSFLSQDGIPLKGWYIRTQGVSLGTVIVVHGINGNRSDMLSRAAFLVRDNYNTLLVDLRDHGESGGNYAGPGYMESRDILGALKYLQNRGQTGPIAAMGHSYGAVAALYATAQSPEIAAVIADGAYETGRRAARSLQSRLSNGYFARQDVRAHHHLLDCSACRAAWLGATGGGTSPFNISHRMRL